MSRPAASPSSPTPSVAAPLTLSGGPSVGAVAAAVADDAAMFVSRISGSMGQPIAVAGGAGTAILDCWFRDAARLVAVCFRFTTDATVASRQPWIMIRNGPEDELYGFAQSATGHGASTVVDYVISPYCAAAQTAVLAGTTTSFAMPSVGAYIPRNSKISLGSYLGQAGDAFSRVLVLAVPGWS